MATPTTPRRPADPGPHYLRDKQNHINNHIDSALRMANGTSTTHNLRKDPAPTPTQAAAKPPTKTTPGSDFMSNEDIHAFAEHLRREARNRAVERSMDAAQLEAVLRHIPDTTGSMSGARARARRVTRHLKVIAAAEKVIAKSSAALYAAFEREYEAELRKVARARPRQQPKRFDWR